MRYMYARYDSCNIGYSITYFECYSDLLCREEDNYSKVYKMYLKCIQNLNS